MTDSKDGMMRIAVISDIHAYSKLRFKGKAPSRLPIPTAGTLAAEEPFSGLKKLISLETLKADVLLCAGDITCQADPDGLIYAWREIHSLGAALGASLTTATTGNHDLDSRDSDNATREEARDHLLGLSPPFPISNDLLRNSYWSKNYALFSHQEALILLLNSCPLHTVANEKEFDRGCVTLQTLRSLENDLSTTHASSINVLLCHHHPQSHAELQLGESDVMKHGQLLLDALERHGDWLVIHGHKHHPKITYAAGGGRSPIIFGAGSFGGEFGTEAASVCRNQFYILDVPRMPGTPGLRGKVHAWNWAYGVGWVASSDSNGALPSQCGFGGRRHPERLAKDIAARVSGNAAISWDTLCASIIDLAVLIPRDYLLLKRVLATRHSLRILEDEGRPAEVGRSNVK